jgi:hypothetical protein
MIREAVSVLKPKTPGKECLMECQTSDGSYPILEDECRFDHKEEPKSPYDGKPEYHSPRHMDYLKRRKR